MPVAYAEIRNEIRSGDLFASQSDHWKARLVRAWTKSPYSHVATLRVEELAGRDRRVWVHEAVLAEVRVYPLSKERRFWWVPGPGTWTREAEEFAIAAAGEAYSQRWAVAAGIGFRLPTMDGCWQCAELTRQIKLLNRYLDVREVRALANAPETPQGLMQWASDCGRKVVEVVNE